MPIWSEILRELSNTASAAAGPDFDGVRRRYLAELHGHTCRNVVLYASSWLQKDIPPALTSINDEDIHALMEVTSGLHDANLDLILHSPGGSPEAAEGIVSYLRSRFQHIRVIVPELAMSAATMISCAANEIMMGKHSFLGPSTHNLSFPPSWAKATSQPNPSSISSTKLSRNAQIRRSYQRGCRCWVSMAQTCLCNAKWP